MEYKDENRGGCNWCIAVTVVIGVLRSLLMGHLEQIVIPKRTKTMQKSALILSTTALELSLCCLLSVGEKKVLKLIKLSPFVW